MSIQPKARRFTEKQMITRTLPYDVAESLKTPEEMASYLEACIEIADGDAEFIARHMRMTEVARQTRLSQGSAAQAWKPC